MSANNGPHPSNPYQPDAVLVTTLTRLLGDTCSHEAVQEAETAGWAPAAWDALAGMGAPWVGVDEAAVVRVAPWPMPPRCCGCAAVSPRRSLSPKRDSWAAGRSGGLASPCPTGRSPWYLAGPKTICGCRAAN